MFEIEISKFNKNIIKHCVDQIKQYNFGKRGIADGNKRQQLVGLIGQTVVSELLQQPWVDGSSGFDNGHDLLYNGKKIDVKTMERKSSYLPPHYANNFMASQFKFDCDAYIFTSLNSKKNTKLTIAGWVTKEEFKKKAKFFPRGMTRERDDGTHFSTKADLYEIYMKDLRDVNSIHDLIKQLNNC